MKAKHLISTVRSGGIFHVLRFSTKEAILAPLVLPTAIIFWTLPMCQKHLLIFLYVISLNLHNNTDGKMKNLRFREFRSPAHCQAADKWLRLGLKNIQVLLPTLHWWKFGAAICERLFRNLRNHSPLNRNLPVDTKLCSQLPTNSQSFPAGSDCPQERKVQSTRAGRRRGRRWQTSTSVGFFGSGDTFTFKLTPSDCPLPGDSAKAWANRSGYNLPLG